MSIVPIIDRGLSRLNPPIKLPEMLVIFNKLWQEMEVNNVAVDRASSEGVMRSIFNEPSFQKQLTLADNMPDTALQEELSYDLESSYNALREKCPHTIIELYERARLPEEPGQPRGGVHDYLNQLLTTVSGLMTVIDYYQQLQKDPSALELSLVSENARLARLCVSIKRYQRKLAASQAA